MSVSTFSYCAVLAKSPALGLTFTCKTGIIVFLSTVRSSDGPEVLVVWGCRQFVYSFSEQFFAHLLCVGHASVPQGQLERPFRSPVVTAQLPCFVSLLITVTFLFI